MVPFIDLFSQNSQTDIDYAQNITGGESGLFVYANKNIVQGSEVHDSFSYKTNMNLLASHGFINPESTAEPLVTIPFEASLREDDPLTEVKQEILNESETKLVNASFDSEQVAEILSVLRFIFFEDKDRIVTTSEGLSVSYHKGDEEVITNRAIE